MKRLLLIGLAISTIAFGGSIDTKNVEKDVQIKQEQRTNPVCSKDDKKIFQMERSGCCSWHGGVAGCDYSGRVVCNDGSLSPSCTCNVPTNPYT